MDFQMVMTYVFSSPFPRAQFDRRERRALRADSEKFEVCLQCPLKLDFSVRPDAEMICRSSL